MIAPAVDYNVLIEAVDAAGDKPPVALRVDRIGRDDFAALVADVVEAQVVAGSGEIVRKYGKTPLRVVAALLTVPLPGTLKTWYRYFVIHICIPFRTSFRAAYCRS